MYEIQKFQEGQKVKIKSGFSFKPDIYKVFGYANPGYDDLVYIIDQKNAITTVPESTLEPVFDKFSYKGYTSTPQWDDDSETFKGHLDRIFAYICWESEDTEHCEEKFHDAVDDYLEFLQAFGLHDEVHA